MKDDKGHGGSYVYSTKAIIDMLEKHRGQVYAASAELGCNYMTILRRAEKQESIRTAINKWRYRRTDVAEGKLEDAITRGEPWAILFQLRTQGRERGYVERQEVTGADGGAVIVKWDAENND